MISVKDRFGWRWQNEQLVWSWWMNGVQHRYYGPAWECKNWWIHGKRIK